MPGHEAEAVVEVAVEIAVERQLVVDRASSEAARASTSSKRLRQRPARPSDRRCRPTAPRSARPGTAARRGTGCRGRAPPRRRRCRCRRRARRRGCRRCAPSGWPRACSRIDLRRPPPALAASISLPRNRWPVTSATLLMPRARARCVAVEPEPWRQADASCSAVEARLLSVASRRRAGPLQRRHARLAVAAIRNSASARVAAAQ